MQDLIICLAQVDQIWEDKQANFNLLEKELSALQTCDILLLPEMFQTGFTMNTELAEPFETSESLAWLKKSAAKFNCAIFTSLLIRENEKVYNRGVFVEPDGTVHSYDKQKTFGLAGEDQFITAGKARKIIEFKGWKIQLNICYDLRFPEILRNSWNISNQSSAYDVLLVVANWPAKRIEHWNALLKARAIENQSYVAAVNRIGVDNNALEYNGHSSVYNALGETSQAIESSNGLTNFYLSQKELFEVREQLPFLKDQFLK